jgi:hypothetical protein
MFPEPLIAFERASTVFVSKFLRKKLGLILPYFIADFFIGMVMDFFGPFWVFGIVWSGDFLGCIVSIF